MSNKIDPPGFLPQASFPSGIPTQTKIDKWRFDCYKLWFSHWFEEYSKEHKIDYEVVLDDIERQLFKTPVRNKSKRVRTDI